MFILFRALGGLEPLTAWFGFRRGHSFDKRIGKVALSTVFSLESLNQSVKMIHQLAFTDLKTSTSRGCKAWDVFGGRHKRMILFSMV